MSTAAWVVLLLVLAGVTIAIQAHDSSKPSSPTSFSDSTATATPTDDTVAPAAATPEETFQSAVRDKLGDSNRDGIERVTYARYSDGEADVRFAANDNLTEGLIKAGARLDTLNIVGAAKELPGLKELNVIVTFPLKDNLGNETEEIVANVTYSASIVKRIQVATIDRDQAWRVADLKSYVHPAFA